MFTDDFAAARSARLVDADTEMRAFVLTALENFDRGAGAWADVVEAASVLWLEAFAEEAPDAYPDAAMTSFQRMLRESLAKTSRPADPPDQYQIDRVTKWLGTVTVNDAAYHGNRAVGALSMRWLSMHDGDVREAHARADGQEASVNGKFKVDGYELRYPGEPVGPPEIWIECRCLLAAGRLRRRSPNMSGSTKAFAAEEITDLGEPDDVDTTEAEKPSNEIPVHGVAAPEGVPTGDGRQFAIGSLTNRELPLPIRYEIVGTHGGMTSDVVTVGRIDELWKDENNQLCYRGVLIADMEHTSTVVKGIEDRTIRGVSVEVDDVTVDTSSMEEAWEEAERTGKAPVTEFTEARVAGFTIVPIPAYQEAFIALGADFEPVVVSEDDGFPEEQLVASAMASLVAGGALPPVSASYFADPGLLVPTPLTIEGDHIFGHLATWGVCHIGIQNACVTAPHSKMNYGMYRTGLVQTDEGGVPVGQITLGTGHATGQLSAAATIEHYDNTGTAVADVAMGEDGIGPWFSGRIRDHVSEADREILQASALSGDWRKVAGNLELVAALAVNTPGFPVPRTSLSASASGQNSLVAAGIVENVKTTYASGARASLGPEDIAGISRMAVEEYRHQEQRQHKINTTITPLRKEHQAELGAKMRAMLADA